MKDITFIAKMDRQGRIRVPKTVRDARGCEAGQYYEVTLKEEMKT